MKHELLTRESLAERFGVDVRTITNWVQAGMPQRTKSGKPVYSWPECRDWREEQIRKDGRSLRAAGGDMDVKAQVAALRLRREQIETENLELDLAQRRGDLVTLDFMRTEFERVALALRQRLLTLPTAWAGRLGACETTVDRQLALQDAVNEALPILGALADDDGEPAALPDLTRDAGEGAA